MKHLRIFNSMEEFESLKATLEDGPYVVLDKDGKVVSTNLKTISLDDITKGEYVDLGLPSGLKWASCNLGAEKPCDNGLLYQWGRVDGYAYGDTNHQFTIGKQHPGDGYISCTPTSGKHYSSDDVLDPEDDAAYVATGGNCRMPTVDELSELLKGTTNEWCMCTVLGEEHTNHTVNGVLLTSKSDETKKIFIPAAGIFSGGDGCFSDNGSKVYIMSSSLDTTPDFAYKLYFASGYHSVMYTRRYIATPVRAVKP